MGIFFAGIEFLAAVDVFAAGVATHGEGCHETDGLLSISLAAFLASEFGRVKVGGIVFAKDFAFRHG